ncbi:MAG: response regulator transcription factor [Lachnospiraceae bacterium]|nr:response regulator transcription factor [Lachnospiraceae bacterium]
MRQVEVVIIDDHVMVREGIKQLLEIDGDIVVVGEAGDGEEGIKLLETLKPDVVLLDINMPKMNGLQVLEELKMRKLNYRVLILTIHNEVEYLVKAVEIGVDGYVLKDSELAVLKKAIFSIDEGKTYIQPSLTPLLKAKLDQMKEAKEEGLTKREIEVLKLIARGMYNKEIADELVISEKTVKNHISNIFRKIDVTDRTQAAIFAIKHSYVEI